MHAELNMGISPCKSNSPYPRPRQMRRLFNQLVIVEITFFEKLLLPSMDCCATGVDQSSGKSACYEPLVMFRKKSEYKGTIE